MKYSWTLVIETNARSKKAALEAIHKELGDIVTSDPTGSLTEYGLLTKGWGDPVPGMRNLDRG